jgi:polyisoprenyl-phosphate glycosyltransferase
MEVIIMLISIVVPVFNEQDNVDMFTAEVIKSMQSGDYDFEIIFVDDGSSDATPLILDRISQADSRVRAFILARNFGHQVALSCGLDHASGDAVITMDGDLQHPPEMIPLLLQKWEEGFEVVQTVRKSTEGVSWFKTVTSSVFYKLINAMSNVRITAGGSDFRLLDQKVVQSFRQFKERARFIRGMISDIGYKQVQIEFVAPPRFAGKSKFSLRKMLNFALDGITAYSKMPLRFALYLGVLFGLFALLFMMDVVYIKLFTEEAVPGWATTVVSILLLGGVQLIGMGIIGEYVGRIFEEVKQRPLYLVRAELKKDKKTDKSHTS